jgi:hypothetical protein
MPGVSNYFTVRVADLLGEPELGPRGDGLSSLGVVVRPDGSLGEADGIVSFRAGEPVGILKFGERVGDGAQTVTIRSLFKHNIARGRAPMQHQSPERLHLFVIFERADEEKPYDCRVVAAAWSRLFAPLDATAAQEMLRANPSGVLVDEVKAGMTIAEVEAVLGPPEKKAVLATKTLYFYPRIKVTFVDGKVSDVE